MIGNEAASCHDGGRTAVGAAELASFGGTDLDDQRSIEEVARRAADVVGGLWWRSAGGPPVIVVAARAHGRSSTARWSSRPTSASCVEIRLARGQRDIATLAHELAHGLAGIEHGHDGRFRAAEIDVLTVLAGEAQGQSLAACFDSFALAIGPRTWPAPGAVVGDTFVLRR